MILRSLSIGLLGILFASQTLASDVDLANFRQKYGIQENQLTRLESIYLDSDLGLKRLNGLRGQLAEFTKKEIDHQDLVQFAGSFAQKMDSLADARLNEFGGNFGLKTEHFEKALDASLDDSDGRNPKAFLKDISQSLMKSASKKLPLKDALKLAKSVQIRMDMKLMRSHLKDADYMDRLLGEETQIVTKPKVLDKTKPADGNAK